MTNAILLQAKLHGNEPRKGAKVDKEIAKKAEIIAKKEAKNKREASSKGMALYSNGVCGQMGNVAIG